MEEQQTDLTQQAEEQHVKILAEGQGESGGAEPDPDILDVGQCQDQGPGEPPCIDPHPVSGFLATLPFSESQEASVQAVIGLSEASRARVLERLWERVATRLIAEEAEQVLREAQPE
jgi:hypothetical protein